MNGKNSTKSIYHQFVWVIYKGQWCMTHCRISNSPLKAFFRANKINEEFNSPDFGPFFFCKVRADFTPLYPTITNCRIIKVYFQVSGVIMGIKIFSAFLVLFPSNI